MRKRAWILGAVALTTTLLVAGGELKETEPAVEPVAIIPLENTPFYLGAGVSAVSVREAGVSVDWDGREEQDRLGNYSLYAGYNYNEYIGLEARYSASYTHEDSVEMKQWSLLAKPKYPVGKDFSLYALLGASYIDLKAKETRATDIDDTQFQWGAGASYRFFGNLSLFADYTFPAKEMKGTFLKASEVDIDMVNVGFTYEF